MNKNRNLRFVSYLVIGYMVMALAWWAILLFRNNKETHLLQMELLQYKYGRELSELNNIENLAEFREIEKDYKRQNYMILGEAGVFIMALLMGMYFIQRTFIQELQIAERQKNFLLSITHELKSPLASIQLILSTFKRKMLPQEKTVELAEDGISEVKRLEELFNKILIFINNYFNYKYFRKLAII